MPNRRKKVKVVFPKKTKAATQSRPASEKKELTRLGAALRTLGGLGGGLAGGLIGLGAEGKQFGNSLGASISKWLGSGDYTVSSNSIISSSLKGSSSIPAMHRSDQSIVVRHREYLGVIKSSTAYTVSNSYSLNPGLQSTFPWLAAIASNYQEFVFKGVVFHYVPTSGMVTGSNTALGSVMIQTAYRATDTAPSNKYEFLNEYWSNECMPSESMVHPIECAPSQTVLTKRYVRTGTVTDDLMFYDYGLTTVATQGQQTDGQVIGDLWVTYEVELRKPRMFASLGKSMAYLDAANGIPTVTQWYTGTAIVSNSFIGTPTVTSPVSNQHQISLPAGNSGAFITNVFLVGSVFSLGGTSALTLVNCTALTNNSESVSISAAAQSNRISIVYGFKITDPTLPSSVTLTGFVLTATTFTRCAVTLSAVDSDFSSIL